MTIKAVFLKTFYNDLFDSQDKSHIQKKKKKILEKKTHFNYKIKINKLPFCLIWPLFPILLLS